MVQPDDEIARSILVATGTHAAKDALSPGETTKPDYSSTGWCFQFFFFHPYLGKIPTSGLKPPTSQPLRGSCMLFCLGGLGV